MQPSQQVGTANPNSQDDYDRQFLSPDKGEVASLEERVGDVIKKAQSDLDQFTANDRSFRRKDTAEVVKMILERVKSAIEEVNQKSEQVRERLYYHIYNATIIIFNAANQLRASNFSREATKYLSFNLLCLDNNLILTTVKYLDWRVMNYVELARAYADFGAMKAALKVINYGVAKVLYSKQVEEQDPPVPEGTKDTLIDALRVLRTQELKYELHSGKLAPDAWKKKLEETFASSKYHRSLAIVECLQTNLPFQTSLSVRSGKISQVRMDALKLAIELVRPDVELVKLALVQVHEKKRRDKEKKDKLAARESGVDIDEILDHYKQLDAEMIAEKDWKFASKSVPIEIHVEMVKLAYECQMWPEFEKLMDPALIRLKFRRYEVPYLATLDVLMSANKIPNIPNGFEKLPQDLNLANLRIELKKLRASAKKGNADIEEKEEVKKEEVKKPVAPPPKDAKGKKPEAVQPKEEPKFEEEDPIKATQRELDAIKHIYVNLLIQKTKNPQNAIVGVDVVLADENLGPELADNHYAVAVPIRQHTGSYEKQGLIPYVVFRRTSNSLIDEEDQLSIVTDVCVIMGQDPYLRPPLGYHKIPVDLRQTPQDLERVPNLDYVFICYKTDRPLVIAERDLLILRRLAELEKSFVKEGSEGFKKIDDARQFLGVSYNHELLVDLSTTIKEALLGPLGDHYIENKLDLLIEVGSLLWKKYLLPVLQRMDYYSEMRGQKEFQTDFVDMIDEVLLKTKHDFVETLNVIHRIFTRNNTVFDIVMYSKCSIFLASFLEEIGEFRTAVQTLRSAIGKVIEFREDRMRQCLDLGSPDNPTTAMSITIDNKKIAEIEKKMETVFHKWEELILRKERDRVRKEKGETALDEDQGDEEQSEVAKCIIELRNKDLFERNIDIGQWTEEQTKRLNLDGRKFFEETEQTVHSLHLDMLLNLYRCEIKLGREMNVVKRQTQDMLTAQGIDLVKNASGSQAKNLSQSQSKKTQISKGKNLTQSKSALKSIPLTPQEAAKLPPPKPQVLSYEKILERENNMNPYQNALLYMVMASTKGSNIEQKSLLLEALEFLNKAQLSEQHLTDLTLDNAVYVKASQKFHSFTGRSPDQIHPLNLLAKAIYIKKTTVPQKPVMICRTSTSITMKLPYFKPLTEFKHHRNIEKIAIYGKPSGSGVAVSLNNTDYNGTGQKKAPGSVVNVTGLIPNEKYVFAAGAYTPEGKNVNGIGETSDEILTLLPLSLHQLYGYLAEIAYKLGHYQIAKQAAMHLCLQFIVKNQFKYSHLATETNPLLQFKLDYEYLGVISLVEAKQLAEAFLILAKVLKIVRNDVQRRADTSELQVEKQKIDMKIANFFCLALEIAQSINRYSLIKRVATEIFNHLIPYFNLKTIPHILINILFKCHQGFRQIPSSLLDSNSRRVLACISYQVVRIGFQLNEDKLVRRVMISELPITSRKWREFSQYVVHRPELSPEEKELLQDQKRRIKLGENIPEGQLVKVPEAYEERLVRLDEFEDEGNAFEEFLLSLNDLQDIVKAKQEKWKEQVQRVQEALSDGESQVSAIRDKLVSRVDFWEQIKLNKPTLQLATLIQGYDPANPHPRYLEFCCKCIRRSLEQGDFDSLDDFLIKIRDGVKLPEDDQSVIEMKINDRLISIEKDIVRKQQMRLNSLEQKVKEIIDQQTMSGGDTTLGPKKLMKLVEESQTDEVVEKNQVVAYASEEQRQQKQYSFLWISEKYLLEGLTLFLRISTLQSQRSLLQSKSQKCVFNDILQIDFSKFKQMLEDHNDEQAQIKANFEEEHKDDNQVYEIKLEDRLVRLNQLLQVMARAAEYAKNSRSWLQLINIIKTVWNVISFDLTDPLELSMGEGWKYLVIIAESSLFLIEFLNNGGNLRQYAGREIDQVQNQKSQLDKNNTIKSVAFNLDQEGEQQDAVGQTEEEVKTEEENVKKERWFEKVEELELSMVGSLIGFTVQALMAQSKWESLVDMSNRLNNASLNEYAHQLLPFTIYAQTTLYNEAAGKTREKRKDLEMRIQQFENWKLTSKKKRSRQAMLTGEIPVEEQEFLRDKQQLEKEIFRLNVIENVLLTDKKKSEELMDNLQKAANNSVESLKQCRKLFQQFGLETQTLKEEERRKGKNHFEIKTRRKGFKVFSQMVIGNYKKCVDLLRKKQQKSLHILALHEFGNLLYADGNIQEAEIQWNECIDTIFQRPQVLSQFREVISSNSSLADAFGSKQVLIGAIVLSKLAKLCYEGKDLFKFQQCVTVAAELLAAPAYLSMPHPMCPYEFAEYQFREFLKPDLFEDQYQLQASELINTLGFVSNELIDLHLAHKSLPLLSMMEFISSDVTKSKTLVVKARILKAIALVHLGYINQAFQIYKKVVQKKNLPVYHQRPSEFSEKRDGKNFYFVGGEVFRNDLSPFADENQQAIKIIQDPIPDDALKALSKFTSPFIIQSLHYLRCLMLLRLGEKENVEIPEKAEIRTNILKLAEDGFRNQLRSLMNAEEISWLRNALKDEEVKEIGKNEEKVVKLKDQFKKALEKVGGEQELKFYDNTEEEMCYADLRSQRLSQILRTRMAIGRILQAQGMNLEAFYVLRQGLFNFKAIAEGQYRNVEKGVEADNKGSFKMPDALQAAAAKQDPKKQPPPPAKDAKGGKGQVVEENQQEKEELAQKKLMEEEAKILRQEVEEMERRMHSHMGLWLETKVEIIGLLYSQKRFEDCQDAIAVTRLESQSANDVFFCRRLQEFEFLICLQQGNLREAKEFAESVQKHALKYFQNDKHLCNFLGNYSEFLYIHLKSQDAVNLVETARTYARIRIAEYGSDTNLQNYNDSKFPKVWQGRKIPNEEELEKALQNVPQSQPPGGKGAPQVKGGKTPATAPPPLKEEGEKPQEKEILDFSKVLEYKLEGADKTINSSKGVPCLYLCDIEEVLRLDVRYAQFLIVIEKKFEQAWEVLKEARKLSDFCLFLSPHIKFYLFYLSALSTKELFYHNVAQFQKGYFSNLKYRESFKPHVPYGSIALGQFMLELPNFSDKIQNEYRFFLDSSENSLLSALKVAKNEAIQYELDMNVIDALRDMAEVCFLQGEYRGRVLNYKYAQFDQLDFDRKIEKLKQKKREEAQDAAKNDSLDEGLLKEELRQLQDKWEESKEKTETLAVYNYKFKSIKYLQAAIATNKAKKVFTDSQHELQILNLTDPSKIPREIVSELFEASSVRKVVQAKQKDSQFVDKTNISSGELLCYMKAVIGECQMLTFGVEKERLARLICKLHRFLIMNLPSYKEKCLFVMADVDNITDAKEAETKPLLPQAEIVSQWQDIQGLTSSMFYILGPLHESLKKKPDQDQSTPITEKERVAIAEEEFENNQVHFGKIEVDPLQLSSLYQDTNDLIDKMKASEKLSEAVNERDKKYYTMNFHQLIERMGNLFKVPAAQDEYKDNQLDYMKIVKDILPPLSLANVQSLSNLLRRDAGVQTNSTVFNGILRRFHRVRYVK